MIELLIRQWGLTTLLLAFIRHRQARPVLLALAEALERRAGEILPLNDVSRREEAACRTAAAALYDLIVRHIP